MSDDGSSRVQVALWRRWASGLIITALIGVGLVVGLFLALQAPQPPAAPTLAPTALAASARPTSSTVATTMTVEKTAIMHLTPVSSAKAPGGGDPVAVVNGRPLDRQALETMAAADRAMAQLLGQPMPDGRDVLERLVNGELVWQAAQEAGFVVTEDEVAAALAAILTASRKSQADLEAGLVANGTTFDAFMAYFRRLVTVDRFAQNQAQGRGQSIATYVAQLQAQGRVSFGPAAQMAAEAAVASPATVAPSPTPRPVSPTLTPAPSPVLARGVEVGQLAPDFAAVVMRAVTNKSYTQTESVHWADLLGKPTVLSFWTTWCPYCARQTPVLIEAYERYEPQGIQFLGINVKEEPAVVEVYLKAKGIPYPIGLDRDGQIAAAYRVSGFPTTYFLDVQGRVVAKHVGQLSAEQIDAYLSRLIMPR